MQFQNHDKKGFWVALRGEGLMVSGSWGSRGCGCLCGGGVSCRIGTYWYEYVRSTSYVLQCKRILLVIDNATAAISDAI